MKGRSQQLCALAAALIIGATSVLSSFAQNAPQEQAPATKPAMTARLTALRARFVGWAQRRSDEGRAFSEALDRFDARILDSSDSPSPAELRDLERQLRDLERRLSRLMQPVAPAPVKTDAAAKPAQPAPGPRPTPPAPLPGAPAPPPAQQPRPVPPAPRPEPRTPPPGEFVDCSPLWISAAMSKDAAGAGGSAAEANRRRAFEKYREIAGLRCSDDTMRREAAAFVAQYEAAMAASPSPPLPGHPGPAPSTPSTPPVVMPPTPVPEATSAAEPAPGPSLAGEVTLDVWQSVWGDFSALPGELSVRAIRSVNLNPGVGIATPADSEEAFRHLAPIVDALRARGVREIRYLYAELSYPVVEYARFLARHRSRLGIETLVDDSEFSNDVRNRYRENMQAVKEQGIRYSAFVTLENAHNSGVTDADRYWVVENLDEPILMSYFGCTLDAQQEALEPYLSHADRLGRKGVVRVAILLGNKSVGRERSCEQQLSADQLRTFLEQVDTWARTHPSYGGLVLESNTREIPRVR